MATTRIPRDFKEFLKLLDARSARFLLIGGYAVNAFGYVRNTVDMDVWIAVDADNQQRVLQAIRDFAFPAAPDDLLIEDNAMVRMGLPPLQIEVLRNKQAGRPMKEGLTGRGRITLTGRLIKQNAPIAGSRRTVLRAVTRRNSIQ